ncbi:zinc ribbon domain-containing protein [uncultured Ruminococcus sp.]|uniref:zinc ribbon domain-containing protein n=1 Tax=uncultured Ruminococcus sp. TaxID=165186 RepID=UPI002636262C|nr:zinc ribbon domain-containing protein [uncultured Ruminococcus sp.]
MKKCPNCGRELHDDAIFCFGCMSEINQRKDIELRTQKKVTIRPKLAAPIAAVVIGSAAVFGGLAYNSSVHKNTAVQKDDIPPQPTTTVTTTLPPATTTTAATTTTKSEPDKAALASDIAEGAALAESKVAAVTTTTTTEKVTEPEIQQDIPQENTEDTQQDEPVEPEYYSPDGASQMTLDLLDYVNPLREKYGLKPLRASGQLDECLQKSLYQMDDYCQGIGNVYEHLSEVGLPNNSKIRQFTANNSCVSDYDEAYTELFTWLKNNASFGLSYGDNLINGLEDYTYLGVCFFHDDIVQERKDHMWNDPDNDEYESMPLYQCYVYVMK